MVYILKHLPKSTTGFSWMFFLTILLSSISFNAFSTKPSIMGSSTIVVVGKIVDVSTLESSVRKVSIIGKNASNSKTTEASSMTFLDTNRCDSFCSDYEAMKKTNLYYVFFLNPAQNVENQQSSSYVQVPGYFYGTTGGFETEELANKNAEYWTTKQQAISNDIQ